MKKNIFLKLGIITILLAPILGIIYKKLIVFIFQEEIVNVVISSILSASSILSFFIIGLAFIIFFRNN